MKRRKVLKSVVAFVPISAAFAGLAAMGIRFITPVKREINRKIFTVGLEELPLNATKRFKDLQGRDLMIVRTGEREVKAISTVCTHLGCTVFWQKDRQEFFCPCHNGSFDKNGVVIAGPPPAPLDLYPVELEGDNVFVIFKDIKEV
ncbi:MAG: Rieske (2Fe-2S) protein [Bacteroidota bacterium]|nr:Rieske (2Fe-2S) protein [Bacteroidota bacterium]